MKRLIMTLEWEKSNDYSIGMSSLFHGVIMESIPTNVAERLHEMEVSPFSQSIELRDNKIIWSVQALGEESEIIIDSLLKQQSIYLSHRDLTLKIIEKSVSSLSFDDLMNEYYFKAMPRTIKLFFKTPTAFKSQKRYVFYPDLSLIFKSLIRRYDSFSKDNFLDDGDLLEQILDNAMVIGYNLRSTMFPVENVNIPSFTGSIKLRLSGPAPLVNLIHMIIAFGEYSGVGIKTALGMGNVSIFRKGACENKNGE